MFVKKIFFILTIFAAASTPLVFAADNTIAVPVKKTLLNIQSWTTAEGARTYFVAARQLPIVDVQVVFAAGSSHDGTQFGVASLTNNLLDEGTSQHDADSIAKTFADAGALFSDEVARDMAKFSLRSLTSPQQFSPALNLFAEVLGQATIPQDAFLRVQKNTLTALQQQQQMPSTIAANAFYQILYGNHPYGHPVMGNQNSVQQITRDDVIAFYKKYYVAKNAIIVIVGAVDRTQAEKIAATISEKLPVGEAAPAVPPAVPLIQGVAKNIDFPSEQTHMLIGQVGINRTSPNFFPLLVGNNILGGSALTSQLFENVREKNGLAYSVSSLMQPMAVNGPFVISLQTRHDQASQALKITDQTVENFLLNGPTADELQKTKKNITGSLPLTLDSNSAIASAVSMLGFYQLPLNYLDTFNDKVNAVTIAQIKQAFNQFIQLQNLAVVQVGQQDSSEKKI